MNSDWIENLEEILTLIGVVFIGAIIALLINIDINLFGEFDHKNLYISNGIVLLYWALISYAKTLKDDFSLKIIFPVPSFLLIAMLSIIGVFIGLGEEMLEFSKPIPLLFISLTSISLFLFSIKNFYDEQYLKILYFVIGILLPFLILFGLPFAFFGVVAAFIIPSCALPAFVPIIHAIIFIILIIKANSGKERILSFYGMSISVLFSLILIILIHNEWINGAIIFKYIF